MAGVATVTVRAASAASGKLASPRAHPVSQLDHCVLAAHLALGSSVTKSSPGPPSPTPWVPLVTARGGGLCCVLGIGVHILGVRGVRVLRTQVGATHGGQGVGGFVTPS